jgi:hypothetical protein
MFALFPVADTCCSDLPNIHASPPNWAVVNNYTYAGTQDIQGEICRKWLNPAFSHVYWDTVTVQSLFLLSLLCFSCVCLIYCSPYFSSVAVDGFHVPCRFSFPNPVQDYYFDTNSFVIGPQDPSWFKVPSDCPPCSNQARSWSPSVPLLFFLSSPLFQVLTSSISEYGNTTTVTLPFAQ